MTMGLLYNSLHLYILLGYETGTIPGVNVLPNSASSIIGTPTFNYQVKAVGRDTSVLGI